MMRLLSLLVALCVVALALAPAVVGDPTEPLTDRVQEKSDQVQEDPQGFVEDHASKEGVSNESAWTKKYACFVAREAAKESGGEPPDLDVCPDYEDAREDDEQQDQAVAEPLDPVQAEADRLVDDSVDTVDRIVDDPGNAWDALKGYLGRSVQAVKRIVASVVEFVRDAVGLTFDGTVTGLTGIWNGLSWAANLPQATGLWMADQALSAGEAVLSGLDAAVGFVASGVTSTVEGIAGLASEATERTVDTVGSIAESAASWTQSVRDAVDSLFESDDTVVDHDAPVDRTDRVTKRTGDLLDSTDDLVPLD